MWQGLVLEAKSLACERGGRLVFENLNFSVKSGEVIELRGPNGAGKSSLLRMIAGLNKPAHGSLNVTSGVVNEQAHYIGHNEAIKPAFTVGENLRFWQSFLGGTGEPALKPFRLEKLADDEARLLSQGQKRRLALSRLVAVSRPIWLLDEPTVGLDKLALDDLCREIEIHLEKGGMVIAATHADLGVQGIRLLELT